MNTMATWNAKGECGEETWINLKTKGKKIRKKPRSSCPMPRPTAYPV